MSVKLSLGSQHDSFGSCWWDSGVTSKVGSSKSGRAGYCTGTLHLPYTTVQELKFGCDSSRWGDLFVLKQ